MVAYVIGEAKINNQHVIKRYGPMVARAVEKFGGRYLARGKIPCMLEGEETGRNILIIEFKDLETARSWFESPEYSAAKAVRLGASTLRLMLVEGID